MNVEDTFPSKMSPLQDLLPQLSCRHSLTLRSLLIPKCNRLLLVRHILRLHIFNHKGIHINQNRHQCRCQNRDSLDLSTTLNNNLFRHEATAHHLPMILNSPSFNFVQHVHTQATIDIINSCLMKLS